MAVHIYGQVLNKIKLRSGWKMGPACSGIGRLPDTCTLYRIGIEPTLPGTGKHNIRIERILNDSTNRQVVQKIVYFIPNRIGSSDIIGIPQSSTHTSCPYFFILVDRIIQVKYYGTGPTPNVIWSSSLPGNRRNGRQHAQVFT